MLSVGGGPVADAVQSCFYLGRQLLAAAPRPRRYAGRRSLKAAIDAPGQSSDSPSHVDTARVESVSGLRGWGDHDLVDDGPEDQSLPIQADVGPFSPE